MAAEAYRLPVNVLTFFISVTCVRFQKDGFRGQFFVFPDHLLMGKRAKILKKLWRCFGVE